MKLTNAQLQQQFQQAVLPLVILSGDDYLLLHETKQQLIHSAKQQGFNEHISLQLTKNLSSASWDQLINQIQTPSLFSPKTCIILQNASTKLDNRLKTLLQQLSEQQAKHCCVIVLLPKVDTATSKTKWFQQLSQQAAWCPIYPITAQQLPQWLQQRAGNYHLRLNLAQAQLIAARTEGNLLAADQALIKLGLLVYDSTSTRTEAQTISDEHIRQTIETSAQYDIFNLSDACLAGHSKRVLRIIQLLQQQQIEPILIIWALAREIRQQMQLFQLMQQQSFNQACQRLRIWPAKQAVIKQFQQRSNINLCQYYLSQLAQCDLIIKGVLTGNIWHKLQQLTISIARADGGLV